MAKTVPCSFGLSTTLVQCASRKVILTDDRHIHYQRAHENLCAYVRASKSRNKHEGDKFGVCIQYIYYSKTMGVPREPFLGRRAQSARNARNYLQLKDVAMSVRERMDSVMEQVAFVVFARQTHFRQLARRDAVVLRAKGSKLARRDAPAVQYV